MRVLLTTDPVGGVWTFTRELVLGLLQRGDAVALASFGGEPSMAQQVWLREVKDRYREAFRFDSAKAPLEWMERNETAYSGAEHLLLHIIDEFKVEVLHSSQFCFGALPVDLPKVVTAHSDVLSWAEACRPDGLATSDWLRQYLSLVTAGLAGAHAVVAPTVWMGEALQRHYDIPQGVSVIRNGRTVAFASSSERRPLHAVTVGRVWDDAKGLDVLAGVDACMPILVVGEERFESACAPELKTVQFLGCMEEKALLETFRRSSLYLVTSIYEPFGLAPLEAALCGCGILARDISSLREVWGDAAQYFADSDSLNRLMSRMSNSPAELRNLQARCGMRARELSAKRMVSRYAAHYEELLATHNEFKDVAAYAV